MLPIHTACAWLRRLFWTVKLLIFSSFFKQYYPLHSGVLWARQPHGYLLRFAKTWILTKQTPFGSSSMKLRQNKCWQNVYFIFTTSRYHTLDLVFHWYLSHWFFSHTQNLLSFTWCMCLGLLIWGQHSRDFRVVQTALFFQFMVLNSSPSWQR